MELISSKGDIIVGSQFKPPKINKFDILHTQAEKRTLSSNVVGREEMVLNRRPEEKREKQTTDIFLEKPPESQKWKISKSIIDYISDLIDDNPSLKIKYEILLWDIEDEKSAEDVLQKLNQALENKLLNQKQFNDLKKFLDEGVESPIILESEKSNVPNPELSVEERSEEQLRDGLVRARKEHLEELARRSKFRKSIAGLGGPERKPPIMAESASFLEAEKIYREAKMALINKLKENGTIVPLILLEMAEREGKSIATGFTGTLSGAQALIMVKALRLGLT